MSINIIKAIRSGVTRNPESETPFTSEFPSSQQQRPDAAMAGPKKTRSGFRGTFSYSTKPEVAMQAAKVAIERMRKKQKEPNNVPNHQVPYSASAELQPMASRGIPHGQHQHASSPAPQPPIGRSPTFDVNDSHAAHFQPVQTHAPERSPSPVRTNRTATIEKSRSFDTYSPYARTIFPHGAGSQDARRRYSLTNDHGIPRIRELILRAGYEFPALQSPPEETVEDGITRFLDRYRELSRSLDAAHQSLDRYRVDAEFVESLKNEVHTLRNELRASKTEIEDRKTEASKSHEEMSKARDLFAEKNIQYEQEKRCLESEVEKVKQQHIGQMKDATQVLHTENERIKTSYENQLRTAHQREEKRHEQTISSLKQQLTEEHWKWTTQLREVKETYETRIRRLEASFDEQMQNEYEMHSQQMQQQKENHERTVSEHQGNVARLKLEAEREERRLREQLQTEQEKVQEEEKRRENELKRQEAKLAQKHTHETLQLRTVNEELKQGLFDRKHFKGLKDRDLANLFRSIAGQVQDFSNVEWKGKRTLGWPFDEHQLLDIHGENTRKLKKQIIQNTLWVLLYDHIFASPFRILGAEGGDLDRDWMYIHTTNASSLKWPEIPEAIEKRRYETAKSFLAVMESTARPSGDDLLFKNGYDRSISELLDTSYNALRKVATLEDRQVKILEGLVRLCARTWIEFCAQPYRLIVSLPGGSGDMLSEPRTKERALTLVLSPELKRYGNSQGEHLANGEVIPGCQAAKVSYPVR